MLDVLLLIALATACVAASFVGIVMLSARHIQQRTPRETLRFPAVSSEASIRVRRL